MDKNKAKADGPTLEQRVANLEAYLESLMTRIESHSHHPGGAVIPPEVILVDTEAKSELTRSEGRGGLE